MITSTQPYAVERLMAKRFIKLLIICISLVFPYADSFAKTTSTEEKIDHQTIQLQSLEKELSLLKETTNLNLANQDKRLADINAITTQQSNNIALVGNYISWTSVALGIFGVIAGIGVFISAKSRAKEEARDAAKNWFIENAKKLEKEINLLRSEANKAVQKINQHEKSVKDQAETSSTQIEKYAKTLLDQSNEGTNTTEQIDAAKFVQAINEELKQKPESAFSAEDHFARGVNLFAQEKYQSAFDSFKEAIKEAESTHPLDKSTLVRYLFAGALTQSLLNHHEETEALYIRTLELDPNHVNALGNYANFNATIRKDYDAADELYQRALDVNSNDASILNNYAAFKIKYLKDDVTAEALFKRSIAANPKESTALSNYANFLTNVRKDYGSAEALYKSAIELDSGNFRALGNYANFKFDILKNNAAAESLYKLAIEANPKEPNNLGNYARLLFINGPKEQALQFLDRAISSLKKNNPAAIDAECWMYAYCCDMNRYPDALIKIKHLITKCSVRTGEWDFSGIVNQAIKNQHPESEWLSKLADVLADHAPVNTLDGWSAWKKS